MRQHLIAIIIIFFPLLNFADSQDFDLTPTLNAECAILIDFEDGDILYKKNETKNIPPASMTKLVTVWTALELLKSKNYNLETRFVIPKEADFRNAPPKSSLMFLQEGQIVSLKELIIGLLIPSGNDCAVAISIIAAGTVENFIAEMNKLIQKEGYKNCIFFDTSGYSDKNSITVKEFAFFCRKFIKKYPQILEFTSIKEFSFPNLQNRGISTPIHGTITQKNHNPLIGVDPMVDGLKTGYIPASGNNIAITAKKGDTRLVAVLAGINDDDKMVREIKRAVDSSALLTYGFNNFKTSVFTPTENNKFKIKNGDLKYLTATNSPPIKITLPKNKYDITLKFLPHKHLHAPILKGSEIGVYELYIDNIFKKSAPLIADVECKYLPFWKKIVQK